MRAMRCPAIVTFSWSRASMIEKLAASHIRRGAAAGVSRTSRRGR